MSASSICDLQGRKVTGKPACGIYVSRGGKLTKRGIPVEQGGKHFDLCAEVVSGRFSPPCALFLALSEISA